MDIFLPTKPTPEEDWISYDRIQPTCTITLPAPAQCSGGPCVMLEPPTCADGSCPGGVAPQPPPCGAPLYGLAWSHLLVLQPRKRSLQRGRRKRRRKRLGTATPASPGTGDVSTLLLSHVSLRCLVAPKPKCHCERNTSKHPSRRTTEGAEEGKRHRAQG
ncbi:uncharacterized protein LOC143506327 [Brachyhypopomus gauderio]|uniref:uncharacterized protein LOC143506327 n=1 Tax=Brachyhypopomus gauderio TaxID=698409 RepID=UPI004041AA13